MTLFSALVCGTWHPITTICFDPIFFSHFLAIIDRGHFVFVLLLNAAFASLFCADVLWHWISVIVITIKNLL